MDEKNEPANDYKLYFIGGNTVILNFTVTDIKRLSTDSSIHALSTSRSDDDTINTVVFMKNVTHITRID